MADSRLLIPILQQSLEQQNIYLRKKVKERSKKNQQDFFLFRVQRRNQQLKSFTLLFEIITCFERKELIRTCRRLLRNNGNWWNHVWSNYSDRHFKQNFRVSRGTFLFLLDVLRPHLQKQTSVELPISPDKRIAIALYRFGRGDYVHTIAELFGVGDSTVCEIVIEVAGLIVEHLWNEFVCFPKSDEDFQNLMIDFEKAWQFPYCFGAIDGCHLPIKCPPGGEMAAKEYHNFKNFYSIVLMAIVDSNYKFIWASCGIPGNTHDSSIFQASSLYRQITEDNLLPQIGNFENGQEFYPLIIGDSAFPFRPWLLKPYTNLNESEEERYFNYRLSRARMVSEGAYGQLKGRWRLLMRKCESKKDYFKTQALACVCLHNMCITLNDHTPRAWDLSEKRTPDEVRDILDMTECAKTRDNSREAATMRNILKQNFWEEKENIM